MLPLVLHQVHIYEMPDSPLQQRQLTWQRVLHTASECLDSMLKKSCYSFHRTIHPQSSHLALYNFSSYVFIQKVIENQSHYKVFRFVVGTNPYVSICCKYTEGGSEVWYK